MPAIKLYQLPIEVLAVIIQKLDIKDVHTLILTCKSLKDIIINDNGIWRAMGRSRLLLQDNGKCKFSNQSWYERCRISHNWCKGRFKIRNVIIHNKNYMPWLKYHQSEALLVTVGSDLHCYSVDENGYPNGRQLQWKISMPQLKRQDKRTDDISRFVLKDNLLVCGNRNGSTAVYKIDNLTTKPERIQYIDNCHIDYRTATEVSCVEITNTRDSAYLVTGSTDSPMVLFWSWDWENECPDLSRGGDEAGISFGMELGGQSKETAKCVALNARGDRLAIGPNGNSRPVVVDINRVEYLIKSDQTSDPNQIVQDIIWHDENTLCYVTHFGRLELMDLRTEAVTYSTRDPFQAAFYCVKSDGSRAILAGSSQHARCVLYDVRQQHHVQLYFTQKLKMTPIYSVDFDSTRLVAAGARGVATLNFNTPLATNAKDNSDCLYSAAT